MSLKAYVAFETETSPARFDVYRSQNGGEQYQLRGLLDEWLDTPHDPAFLAALPGNKPQQAHALLADNQHAEEVTHGVIDETPTATGVTPSTVGASIPAAETEVLYVVTNDAVETFIPVNPSPTIFTEFARYLNVDVYRFNSKPQLQYLMENLDEIDGISLSGNDFTPSGLTNQSAFIQKKLRHRHRYLVTPMTNIITGTPNPQLLTFAETIFESTPRDASDPPVVDTPPIVQNDAVCIHVPWSNDTPKYVMQSAPNEQPSPADICSHARWDTYLTDGDTASPRQVITHLAERFGEDIAWRYTPDAFL